VCIASVVAVPMHTLSRVAYPLVRLLSLATEAILAALRVRPSSSQQVTEEDIKGLMEQGTAAGIFGAHEEALVRRVFRLDKLGVSAIMTARTRIIYVDSGAPAELNLRRIAETGHARYPISRDGLLTIEGIVLAKSLLADAISGKAIRLDAHVTSPPYVRSTATVMELVELFRKSRQTMALVYGERGAFLGLVTLHDVMEALAGGIAAIDEEPEREVVKRGDGSWLIAGTTPVERMKEVLELDERLPGEDALSFHSVGGFVMHQLNRVPSTGESFECMGWRFEVVDMDERRVDKVLATRNTLGPAIH
jgi:putative hemolysin